jgi:hypothetical protein
VVLVSTRAERRIRKAPKERIAGEIMDEVVEMLERDGRPA